MSRTIILAVIVMCCLVDRSVANEPATVEQIYGCWRRDVPSRDGSPAFMSLCFRKDLTADGAAMGDGHGHDLRYDWWLKPRGELVIDEQSCFIAPDNGLADSMVLTRCIFMGLWKRMIAYAAGRSLRELGGVASLFTPKEPVGLAWHTDGIASKLTTATNSAETVCSRSEIFANVVG